MEPIDSMEVVALSWRSPPAWHGPCSQTRPGSRRRFPAPTPAIGSELLTGGQQWKDDARRIDVARIRTGVSVGGLAVEPAPPGTLFADWLHHPDGRWEALETTVPAAPEHGDPRLLGAEAAEHYRRALLLGTGAPAELGLAQLARDAGRSAEAATRLAAARGAVPALPALPALASPAIGARPPGPERGNSP